MKFLSMVFLAVTASMLVSDVAPNNSTRNVLRPPTQSFPPIYLFEDPTSVDKISPNTGEEPDVWHDVDLVLDASETLLWDEVENYRLSKSPDNPWGTAKFESIKYSDHGEEPQPLAEDSEHSSNFPHASDETPDVLSEVIPEKTWENFTNPDVVEKAFLSQLERDPTFYSSYGAYVNEIKNIDSTTESLFLTMEIFNHLSLSLVQEFELEVVRQRARLVAVDTFDTSPWSDQPELHQYQTMLEKNWGELRILERFLRTKERDDGVQTFSVHYSDDTFV